MQNYKRICNQTESLANITLCSSATTKETHLLQPPLVDASAMMPF